MAKPEIFTFVSNENLAWILQLASTFLWASSFIYPNEHRMHFMETNLSRALVGFYANYLIVWYYGGSINLRDGKNFFYATFRSVANTVTGVFNALLMFYLPMPIIHTITSLATIYTVNFEHYCFGVTMTSRTKWLALISVIGVVLLSNGELISHKIWPNPDGSTGRISQFQHYIQISALGTFFLSFAYACYISIHSLGLIFITKVQMTHYELNCYNNLIHLVLVGLFYFIVPQEQKSPLKTLLLSLPFSGAMVFLAQLTFVLSLQLCKSVGMMLILNTTNILIAYLYSLIRYKQKLDIFSLIGVVITIGCVILVILDRYK